MLARDFESLNTMQKQAVETVDKSLLVLAPAGTGKTKVIAMRTAYLVKQGVLPEQILCLTFTNKAAKEMKERITSYMPKEAKNMTIKTFHSYCYHLISQEKEASHFTFPCTLIDETDSLEILKKIIAQNGLNDDDLYYPSLLSFFENVKRHSLSLPIEVRYNYREVMNDYFKEDKIWETVGSKGSRGFIQKYGLQLLNTYTRYLKENNCIDFMDLIVEAKYLLEQPEILKKWQMKYHHIQVDEMQDTSSREYEIIRNIAQGHFLAMFGDFNQTIYEWRGSSPAEMTANFKQDFHPEEIALTTNYRSTQTLLNAANDYIASSRLYPIQCMPKAVEKGSPITILEAETKMGELIGLAKSVRESRDKGSVAVLTRTNGYAKDIAKFFNHEGISCTVIEDTKFFRRKEIKDLLAFFDYSINMRNGHALLKICEHPYINMPQWLIKALRQTKDSYLYLHDWFRMASRDPYGELDEAFEKNEVVVLDVESTGLNTTKDDIIQIAAIQYGAKGVTNKLDVLLKPTKSVGDSVYVHGFTDEELAKKGIAPKDALTQLGQFTKGKVLVGHNINYDLQIISSMLSRYEMPPLEGKSVYDTLDLACKVYPKLPNHKLDTLSKLIETDSKPNHNAFWDIMATGEVLAHLRLKIAEKKQQRLEYLEAYYCYVQEYKEKVMALREYIISHTILESMSYMMNVCGFKGFYDKKQMEGFRELYRMIEGLNEEELSIQDNIINLLAFSALHYSEIEQSDLFKGRIPIITVHQAKGLEFDEVYIAGCNDCVFPSYRSVKENKLTEEMRLFYVAITRAKQHLYISYHHEKKKSIFIDKIGKEYKSYKKI
nr:3'-5' exonuclease [uncultured Cellulosilyticum sp.]